MKVRTVRCMAALLSAAAVRPSYADAAPTPATAPDAPLWTALPKPRKLAPPPSTADLAERARPAVVHVRGLRELGAAGGSGPGGGAADGERGVSVGTGFILNPGGHIVTNEHVVRQMTDLRVRLYDGRELPACVIGADAPTDIALLKVEAGGTLPVLPFGDSDALRVGEPAMAIGNPFGFNHSVTTGIVSAKERVVDRSGAGRPSRDENIYSFFIQTDASINVGNSGGPLLDGQGAVIGVNAAFWAGHPMQPAQGIGFAIPINMVKSLLPQLRESGDAARSSLGVDAQPLDSSLAVAWKLPSTRGALIAQVEPGSPAEAAGLEPGDVVVSWDGAPVSTDEDLKIRAQLSTPQARVQVGILRRSQPQSRHVTLRAAVAAPGVATRPPHPAGCGRPRGARDTSWGFEVEEAKGAAAARLPGGHGVLVQQVASSGPAVEAGLRRGDALLRVGASRIRAREDINRAFAAGKPGDTLPMLVKRDGRDFWIAYTRR